MAAPAGEAVVVVAAPSRNGADPRHVLLDVPVSATTHGYLRDHALGSAPLVPVALAIEWLLRGARDCHRDPPVSAIRDLRVLRAIHLPRIDEGERLVVRCEVAPGETRCLLLQPGHGARPCVTAVVHVDGSGPAASSAPEDADEAPACYDGVELFHGPMFRVLRTVGPISERGVSATLVGLADRGWPAEPWITDPAACDAAMQLAVLWTGRMLGAHTLPMAVGTVRVHRPGPVSGPVRARAIGRSVGTGTAVCDVILFDAAGGVVAELGGIECVRRPETART
jgi:hypothetical protein